MLKQLNVDNQLDKWLDNLEWGGLCLGSKLPKPFPIISKVE